MAGNLSKRTLIYETVIEHIKAQLINGELRPGARLPTVAALAEQLEVGQASVREAYRILESMGILEVTQGRGTFVSFNISQSGGGLRHFQLAEQQTLSHLLETRKLLEPGIAALAAQRATPAEAQAVLNAALEMERLAQQGEDFIEPDVRFHELILLAAHNPVVTKIFSALSDLLLDSRRLSSRIPGATEKAIHFHKLIALAIKEGNASTAQALMYQHVEDVERDILRGRGKGGWDYWQLPEVLAGCNPIQRQLLGELGSSDTNYMGDDPVVLPVSRYWRPREEDIPLKAEAESKAKEGKRIYDVKEVKI